MTIQSNVVTVRKIALIMLMTVFQLEFLIFGVIKGLEGLWLGWFVAAGYLALSIYAIKGKLFIQGAYSGGTNTFLLITIGLGVISMGMILFNDLVVS